MKRKLDVVILLIFVVIVGLKIGEKIGMGLAKIYLYKPPEPPPHHFCDWEEAEEQRYNGVRYGCEVYRGRDFSSSEKKIRT